MDHHLIPAIEYRYHDLEEAPLRVESESELTSRAVVVEFLDYTDQVAARIESSGRTPCFSPDG